MIDRSKLFSFALIAAIASVGWKTYRVWSTTQWELPKAEELSAQRDPQPEQAESRPVMIADTKTITERNLFDPERGASESKRDKEAEALALAAQKIRSLILIGTAVLGESRYAIVEDSGDPRSRSPRPELQPTQRGEMRRLKLGETVEGFKLSAVEDRKVLFVNGSSQVELALDYFRKVSDRSPGERSSGAGRAHIGPRASVQTAEPFPPTTPLAPRFPRRDARKG